MGHRERRKAGDSLHPKLVVFENKMEQEKIWVSFTGIELELRELRESWGTSAQGRQANRRQCRRPILSPGSATASSIYHHAIWEPRAASVGRRQLISWRESLLDPQFRSPISPCEASPSGDRRGTFSWI